MRSAGVALFDSGNPALPEDRNPLSLKARETAALSLKRIFEEQLHQQQQQRRRSSSVIVPTAACSDEASKKAIAAQSCSPAMSRHPDLHLRLAPPSTSYEGCQTIDAPPSAIAKRNEAAAGGGQLTILYAGSVRVYEDVPADKAQAILLLASGSSRGSHKAKYPATLANAAATARARASSAIPSAAYRQIRLSKSSSPPPAAKAFSRSQADLPFARKVSLSRFLGKRKERLENKAMVANKSATCSLEEAPPKKLGISHED